MSLAKRCDVCKEFHEPYGHAPYKVTSKPNALFMASMDELNEKYHNLGFVNCCPKCMESIADFIESLKEKEND